SRPTALLGAALTAAALTTPTPASAAEPPECLSPDPAQWPAPSRPYFQVIIDTSGSMTTAVAGTNSCNYPQNDRIAHARCAMWNTVNAYSGEVNFGLASYTWKLTGCPGAACFTGCAAQYAPNDNMNCGPLIAEPTLGFSVHAGGYVVVPMLQDHYWM